MNDKIITHEDLPMLKSMRAAVGSPEADLLDRLIAAAEADRFIPLRPTVTKTDVREAVEAFKAAEREGETTRGSLRAAFEAAGIEVTS